MLARMYRLYLVSFLFNLHLVLSDIPERVERPNWDRDTAEFRKERSPRLDTSHPIYCTSEMKDSPNIHAKRSRSIETDTLDEQDTKLNPARFRSRQRRSVVGRTVGTPWTDGIIPYELKNGNFTDDQIQWIKRGMRNWEEVTCVRFRPATSTDKNRLKIHTGPGCSTRIGMEGGEQPLELHSSCFSKGIVEHELGHTLGLIHEHQREQRDSYIKVDYYKVERAFAHTLQKYPQGADDKMEVEYDYHSIMHYTRTAYSLDGGISQTIYTRDPTKEYVIGMALKPSFLDAKVISLMYKCADKCERRHTISCTKDCFLTADCKCFCKEHMPKESCEDKDPECPKRAKKGECWTNVGYTETNCRKSCRICTVDGSPPGLPCEDYNDNCQYWASTGECDTNPGFTRRVCRLSCGECTVQDDFNALGLCEDKSAACWDLAAKGDCDRNTSFMVKNCTETCDFCPEDVGKEPNVGAQDCMDYDGVCQIRADSGWCQKHYALMMTVDCRYACGNCYNRVKVPEGCDDQTVKCRGWAYQGECEANPNYMLPNCRLSCDQCDGLQAPGH